MGTTLDLTPEEINEALRRALMPTKFEAAPNVKRRQEIQELLGVCRTTALQRINEAKEAGHAKDCRTTVNGKNVPAYEFSLEWLAQFVNGKEAD